MFKLRKPIAATAVFFFIAIAGTLLVVSCNNPADGVFIPVPKDSSALSKIDHFIPESRIKEYRSAFAAENDSLRIKFPSLLLPDAEAFNKPALIEILKDPRTVGIRIYHGVKRGGKQNEVRVIIVGVDAQGKDVLINKGSAVAAQANSEPGGEEQGQCPTCQTGGNNN